MKNLVYLLMVFFILTGCSVEPLEPMPVTTPDLEVKASKNKNPHAKFGIPILTAGEATENSLQINVTAGENGATGGLSLRWMTLESFDPDNDGNGQWNNDLGGHILFNGNADDFYSLEEGEIITLTLPADLSGKDGFPVELECGMSFVFIVQAHQDGKIQKSDYSEPFIASTAPCEPDCNLLKQDAYSMDITKSELIEKITPEGAPEGDIIYIDEVYYSMLEIGAPIVDLDGPKLADLYQFYIAQETAGATTVPLVYHYQVGTGDCTDSAVLTINVIVE